MGYSPRSMVAPDPWMTPQEAAADLKVEISTIHAHKTPIFELCRNVWDLAPDTPLDYRWLHEKFRAYFES